MIYRIGLCVATLALAGVVGCSTKNYVRSQTAPLIDHTNSLEDKSAENPSEMTAYALLKEKIRDVLDTLTERERAVLEQRFGLNCPARPADFQ